MAPYVSIAPPGAASVRTLRPTSRGKIISQDPRITSMLETIDRIARSTCTVLVSGESGTGKELVVAALHDASARRAAPLVTINCGAIPENLLESELFGHTRGAFTGATSEHRGLVATAEGGTLFLDEIGELPLGMQVKLLRLLQQREYTPLGATESIRCDVRIVAATNRDLEVEVAAGRFREDLFYRLNVIHLELPPLRERRGDLRLLARHFCRVFAERSGRDDLRGLSDAAIAAIEAYPWPGNVRALENALERGVLLAHGPFVEPEDVFGRVARRLEAAPLALAPVIALQPAAPPPLAGPRTSVPESVPPHDPLAAPAVPSAAMAPLDEGVSSPAPTPATEALAGTVSCDVTVAVDDEAPPPSKAFPRTLPTTGIDLFKTLESYQNSLIRQALARTGGNRNQAARLLGMNRTTLVEMIRRRGL